jgi:ABC-type uncharacterized transport system involved in gliding motility auxiliary subunit
MEFWQRRSTKVGTNALLAVLVALVLFGLINFLGLRYSQRIDLTENQLFTLSPESQKVLKSLNAPLKVWIFQRDANANLSEEELLQKYQENSQNFSYQIIDPDKSPGLAQQFKELSQGKLYRVYLDTKDKKQPIRTVQEGTSLSEAQLTDGMQSLQRNQIPKVYFLQGHGEYPLKSAQGGLLQAVNSLEDKGYLVQPWNLAEKTVVPEDTDALVIAGPKRKLFPQEVTALENYLQKGGNLLILIDPEVDAGLDPLLKTWGVKLDNRIVVDGSGAGQALGLGPATPIITSYGQHPITQDFANGITVFPVSRAIATVPIPGVEAVSLLVTSGQMWAESEFNSELTFDPSKDLPGPFDLGVALTRTGGNKLVIIGNSTFATDGLFQQQLNGDVFLNAVQWLALKEPPTLSIRPREAKNRRINLTPLTASLVFWLSIVVFPLLGFLLAGISWWRRR